MEMVHFIPPSQRRLVLLATSSDTAPVLISGASGSGKSSIARWIHRKGSRANQPLVIAEPKDVLPEKLAEAQGGTLLITEIGEWTRSQQLLLAQVLTRRMIPHPQNPSTPLVLNVRLIFTSSQNLSDRAQAGLFSGELHQVVADTGFTIAMPDLSQRNEEFDSIILGVLNEITRELHREYLKTLSPEAWEKIRAYDWPGNIRELRNVLRVAVINAANDRIEDKDLPQFGQDQIDFRATRTQFERIYLTELLKTCNWRIEKASQAARLDPEVLVAKLKELGIERFPNHL